MQPAAAHYSPALPEARYFAHRVELDAAVAQVLAGGQYILGEQTAGFEAEFARFVGAKHAVGVANGTDALELALRACGIGRGDAVLTVSWTATATVAAIERAGATPILVDIDETSFTMDPAALTEAIEDHQARLQTEGSGLKAVVVVHLYGHPADMASILKVARANGLRVIEDCAQAHGATLDGRMAGTWGDAGAFSFYPTKNLGAFGDGGAVVTNEPGLADKVRMLREYGWVTRQVSSVPGVNSRLDELQAAMLRVLLPHLTVENARRRELAVEYQQSLAGSSLKTPQVRAGVQHAFHQYVVRSSDRDRLKEELRKQGIATQVHYPLPIHLMPAYERRLAHGKRGLKSTETIAKEVLSLPMSPYFTQEKVRAIVGVLSTCKDFL